MFQWLTTMRALSLRSIVSMRTFSYRPLHTPSIRQRHVSKWWYHISGMVA